MLKYNSRDEMLENRSDKCYTVIDLPANGMIWLDRMACKWAAKYPALYSSYRNMSINQKLYPGGYKFMEAEDGAKFFIICTRWADTGEYAEIETFNKMREHMLSALISIKSDLTVVNGPNYAIISSVLGRRQHMWQSLSKTINSMFPTWTVYTR